ncbi:MAG: urease accessory protein UreH [Chloroflexi bacterium]|nr:urease accessory protein UreH [Chloroflexota bacterium]MBI3930832.1 urease accessory protein UreH [Chloroflexota bacterium]
MPELTSPLAILLLGLLLGVKHAFDPDHLVAVTTIVSAYRNPLKAIWIGVSWGLGHTTTLLLMGVLLLFVKITMPERIAHLFEFLVGVVLVILGIQVFWSLRRSRVHFHPHSDDSQPHTHFHSHVESPSHAHHRRLGWSNLGYFLIAGVIPGEHPQTALRGSLKPFLRLKSYVVGTIHGLAGSAALMLLVLASLESRWLGVWYILLFGLGSVVSMGLVTILLALPFSVSARLPRLNRMIQYAAGVFGILFGILFMYQAGLVR